MLTNSDLKHYNKKKDYSYSFGPFPTIEMLKNKPQFVEKVLLHSDLSKDIIEKVESLCKTHQIPLLESNRVIDRIREKENCFIIGVFHKYSVELDTNTNHIVLVRPNDMGNLGTIIRTSVGFGIKDLAIIGNGADIFNPKTIRASMGAFFHLRFHYFENFEAYQALYGAKREMYPFMLKGAKPLGSFSPNLEKNFSLIFGNEAAGLEESYQNIGQSVLILHSDSIDSLNLSEAVGIGIYEFTKEYYKINKTI